MLTLTSEPKSKRVTVRLRHRIEKASAAKQRKAKKQAKKVQRTSPSVILKYSHALESRMAVEAKEGPGNPESFPFQG